MSSRTVGAAVPQILPDTSRPALTLEGAPVWRTIAASIFRTLPCNDVAPHNPGVNDVAKRILIHIDSGVDRGRADLGRTTRCGAGLCWHAGAAAVLGPGPAFDPQRRMAEQRCRPAIHPLLAC